MLLLLLAMLVPPGICSANDQFGAKKRTIDDSLDEVIVVATRNKKSTLVLPYATDLISREELSRKLTRSLPQALLDTPGVMVQETAFGQGSPYIRGFTGFRNVMLVDGIRLNNSALRDGPNQYWATVDHFSLDRIEVVSGPASTLYGSDAVGGTVNALTPDPFLAESSFRIRAASAEHSIIGRLEVQAELGEAGAIWAGVTRKQFGDLDGADLGTQKGVGYDEQGYDLKVSSRFGGGWRFDALAQQVKQINVPRTHRTSLAKSWRNTKVGSDKKRELDQTRKLAYLRLTSPLLHGLVNSAVVTLSNSHMDEERDRIRSSNRREMQGFDVATLGANIQLSSNSAIGMLTYGIDYYRDEADSFSSRNLIQGPIGDDASYRNLDVFLQNQIAIGDRVEMITGVRRTQVKLDANSVMHPVARQKIKVSDKWRSTVFNARVSYALIPGKLVLYTGAAEAFRAPNLSDTTRFDSSRSNEFEIPAPMLNPEEFLSIEAGLKWSGDSTQLYAALFRTRIDGQIERYPTGRTIDGETEITKANIGDGWVKGAELSFDHQVAEDVTLFGTLTWMDGKVDTFATPAQTLVSEPASRLMPLTGALGLRWKNPDRRFWAEMIIRSADHQDKLSTRDASDTSRIPIGGTPGYAVLNLGAGYQFSEKLTATFAIDNLNDIDYRIHGSGTNMPGRNLMLGLEMSL